MSEGPSTELEKVVPAILDGVRDGSISFTDLLKAISDPAPADAPPATLPVPAAITTKQKAALEKLSKVFGQVVPAERRALDPIEIKALSDEREVLDEIAKMATERKEAIRTTIANHLDVDFELRGGKADRDAKGHYIAEGAVLIPETGKVFDRTVTETVGLSPDKLQDLVLDGMISKKDYLSMTSQVRVIDQAKVMLHLRKNPRLVTVLGKASVPIKRFTTIKAKKAKT